MKIEAPINISSMLIPEVQGAKEAGADQASFGQFLKDAISEVNDLQNQSRDAKQQLITGNVDDVAQVLIAGEKASVALQLTIQVRNKVIEAYQDIMRMQV